MILSTSIEVRFGFAINITVLAEEAAGLGETRYNLGPGEEFPRRLRTLCPRKR